MRYILRKLKDDYAPIVITDDYTDIEVNNGVLKRNVLQDLKRLPSGKYGVYRFTDLEMIMLIDNKEN